MITVREPVSPTVTTIENQRSRVRMRGNGHAKKIKELRSKKLAGENNINDSAARLAMILADEEIPAASDIDAQITTEMLNWEATIEAERSLKPKLDAARYEASTAILTGLKPEHDAVVKRLLAALVEASAANAELFQLSRDLVDKGVGRRCGVCELMPDFLGVPHKYSDFAEFMRSAVKAGYLSTLPKEFR